MHGISSPTARRTAAKESFGVASECIGPITPGMSLFAITRGQFSMIDAILHTLDCVGPAAVSVWTWTVAEYEVECLKRLQMDGRVTSGRMVIDHGALKKNAAIILDWKATFGAESVRYVVNHAKLATVSNDNYKVLLRGSMNLNRNPRFEQLDVTEGGADFDLVKRLEDELPVLADSVTGKQAYAASRVGEAFDQQELALFSGIRVWAK